MNTKIIIGLSVVALLGYGLFLWQIRKSGELRETNRAHKKEREEIADSIKVLEQQLKQSQAREIQKDSSLLAAKAEVSKYAAQAEIFKSKIKIDSALLEQIESKNNEIDSLSNYFTIDDWDCYIAKQVGEDCN